MSLDTTAQIERALQGGNLPDQLAAIAQCSKTIRENPFPGAVNALLSRLIDIFQDEKNKADSSLNLIRLRIIKLLKECNTALPTAQDDAAVRCIMKVLTNNDYKARSLAMLFLAAIAPVLHSNKKIQFVILESLNCKDPTELTAAIIATGALGRLSSDVSEIVIEKIGSMLHQDDIDTSLKIRLVEDLAHFQQTPVVINHCMDLARYILQTSTEQRLIVSVINALTQLTKKSGFASGGHIDMILNEIGKIQRNEVLMKCCLTNLLELADSPHHWASKQVMRLFDYQNNVCAYESNEPLILWLQSLDNLIKHIHIHVLQIKDVISRLTPLTKIRDFTVKIHIVQVICSRAIHENQPVCGELVNSLSSEIISELGKKDSVICLEDRIKFYTMVSFYINNTANVLVNVGVLGFAEFLMKIDNSYPELVFMKSLETLNLLCDTNHGIERPVCGRMLSILKKNYGGPGQKRFSDAPTEIYSLAFLPFSTYSTQLSKIISSIQNELAESKEWCFALKLARLGFRYGHWKAVSFPLLNQIQGNCDTIEASSFVMALTHIAKAHLPKEFDVEALNAARQNLSHALLLLTPLVENSRNSQDFEFATQYVNCLYDLFGIFNTMMVILNSNCGIEMGSEAINHMVYTQRLLKKAHVDFGVLQLKWIALQKKSFDSDEHTRQHLELMARYCMLFESILTRMFSSDYNELAPMDQQVTSSINNNLKQLIEWGINQTNQSIHAVTGSLNDQANIWKNNFECFVRISRYLRDIPLNLPQSFFQQQSTTKVKLNVVPQPRERGQPLILNTKQLALSIEGVIETNNPKPIQTITVQVCVYYSNSEEPKIIDTRTCDNQDNYFRVNFMLIIGARNAEVVTSLLFMDSVEKRTWNTGVLNRFNVTVPEARE